MKTTETTSLDSAELRPTANLPGSGIARLTASLLVAATTALAQPADVPILRNHPTGAPSLSWVPNLSSGSSGSSGPNPAGKPAPNPPPPINVIATFTGTPYSLGVTRTPTSTAPEAEEHIAVDPCNPNNLVAAISDFSIKRVLSNGTITRNTTKYALSWDAGNSWRESFVPTDANHYPITSDGHSWEANSDPVVAIDNNGTVFMVDLYFNSSDNANGVYVNVGDLSGAPFSAGVPVAFNYDPNTSNFEDKPWIAVDNTGLLPLNGRVYVTWTHFYSSGSDIYFSSSADQSANWSTPIIINPPSQSGRLQGSQVAVGPDGTVYVIWYAATYNSSLGTYQNQQHLAKSTTGGQSFSTATAISPVINVPTFTSSYRKGIMPALGVDPRPNTANLYVVWADQPDSTLGSEIKFIASHDGGAHFSSPVIINDKSVGQQFMPALTVDAQGTVHCMWFDTRNSPDGTAEYFDIYATYTANGGTSFTPNARVTSATIPVQRGLGADPTTSFIGDYAGIAASGGYAHPVWTTSSQLQAATLLMPGMQDFSLSASPGVQYVLPGQSASCSVNVSGYSGFGGTVNLSVSGLPADAVWSFDSPSLSGNGSSTLTVTSSTIGSYELTITGASEGMSRKTTVIVNVSNRDFTLSVAPAYVAVPSSGGTANYTLSLGQILGLNGTVSLSIDGLPLGASFTPQFVSVPSSATLSVSVPAGTEAKTYALTITGTAASDTSLTHTAAIGLNVIANPTAVYVTSPSGANGYSLSGGKNNTANLTIAVVLKNNFGTPVAGASVANTLYLNGASYGSANGTTDSNGTATFILRNAPVGTYVTKVTSVTAAGLTWDGWTPPNSFTKSR